MVLAFLLASAAASATEVYRWVDADGQAHFSDQWRPGAEKIQIRESAVFSAPRVARDTGSGPSRPADATQRYQTLDIASPAQEEVLWNIEGQLRVSLRVAPALQPGHDLRLYLNGALQEMPRGSTEVQLTDVFRGTHTLRAEIVDAAGNILISSQPNTFTVRQTSIVNPSRPQVTPTPRPGG